MFSRKTSSAICALLITSSPLPLFAQEIVRPAPPEVSIFETLAPLKMPGQVRRTAYQSLVPLVSPQEAMAKNPTLRPPTGQPTGQPQVRTAALLPLKPILTPPIQLRNNPLSPPGVLNAKYRAPSQVSDGAYSIREQRAETIYVAPVPAANVKYASPSIQIVEQPVGQATEQIVEQPVGQIVDRPAMQIVEQAIVPVERAASPEVIIRTPFVQPHNPNLYLFVVENVGGVDATSAEVELQVPEGVVIRKVIPATATATAQRAIVRISNLKAGDKSIIEVEVNPTTELVDFQTRLALESVHRFTTAADPQFAARSIGSASHQLDSTEPTQPIFSASNGVAAAAPEMNGSSALSPLTPLPNFVEAPVPVEVKSPFIEVPASVAAMTNVDNAANSAEQIVSRLPLEPADTSGRTGRAQPPNIANAVANQTSQANQASGTQAQLVSATSIAAATSTNLSATVEGPVTLNASQQADFSITITNPNRVSANNVVIQLQIPAGLKITVLDREAWFDEENQTMSWEVSGLDAGAQETIQYRAVGQAIGQQNQKVTIGMDNIFQGKAQLVTLVSN